MNKSKNYFKDNYYHLYNRGANKALIFFERENYLYFLRRIKHYSHKFNINILCYCLMPNHFHIFLKQISEEFSVSLFMAALLNSYVKSVNKKYKRSGTLFESKTKSKQITDEQYFIWVIKYILEIPVEAGLVPKIIDWEYSNAKDLFGIRNGTLTDVKYVQSFFQSRKSMVEFLTTNSIESRYEF